ncbi:arginase [Deinococcus psychrotolerans]|uniref:Arginase n=1 Tax=Deinococcus psychrotolerans TaxID=2489213 RepID=A0A3G8Y9I4_9DEIO|nr:arginase [Deinococcus psychrotolerans]AZI42019.1 arginase [Deinococcus psychrotolerans]
MDISILGIPMDLGAGRRGVDMGASALRNAHLASTLRSLGHTVTDLGDVPVTVPETTDKFQDQGLVFLDEILSACSGTYQRLRDLDVGTFPISLGGDHSVSMGTVPGAARGRRTGVIWVDAHADFNTPSSSPSGNIHGMPVAHLVGLGDDRLSNIAGGWHVRPEDIVMIGLRSVDQRERELVAEAGIKTYTMKDVDQLGITRIAQETLERLSHLERLHISFDADALDPTVCPGVGTPVPGGLSYREGHLLMELFAESGRVTSLDIVEVNPILDTRNRTAEVMVGMAASLLGQRIL